MIFHFYQRRLDFAVIPTLIMKNVPIIRVENFDFLGLTINETLQWTAHLSKISSKILKVTGIMNRLKSYLPISNLKLIYNSLILPHLNYCNLLWGKHSAKIQKVQKRAVRVVTKSKYNAHTEPLFKIMQFLKLEDIFNISCLKFYFKFQNSMLPEPFLDFYPTNASIHDHYTRQSNNPHLIPCHTTAALNSPRHYIPSLIAHIPPLIQEKFYTHSYAGFSNYIKRHYINNYREDCSIMNCYICSQ